MALPALLRQMITAQVLHWAQTLQGTCECAGDTGDQGPEGPEGNTGNHILPWTDIMHFFCGCLVLPAHLPPGVLVRVLDWYMLGIS